MQKDDILLIDAGNSCVKWNYCHTDDSQLLAETCSVAHESGNVERELSEFLQQHQSIRHAVISNVAGDQVEYGLRGCLASGNDLTLTFVHTQESFAGLKYAYPKVEKLGVDRWLAVLAAAELYLAEAGGKILCIAGCGSATTVDFLTPDRRHLGGMISAGSALIRRQLGQDIANIATVSDDRKTQLFATDTEDAVVSGARYAVAGMINSAAADAERELQRGVQLLVSGGGSDLIMPLLRDDALQDKDLVLKGLAIFARMTV